VSESVSKLWIDEECATVVEIVVDIFIHSFIHTHARERASFVESNHISTYNV